EVLVVFGPAVLVDLVDADAIDLLRHQARLESLLRGAFEPRAGAVVAPVRAPYAAQLAVDVARDAGIAGARTELVGRNEALDRRIQKTHLLRRQEPERVGNPGIRHACFSSICGERPAPRQAHSTELSHPECWRKRKRRAVQRAKVRNMDAGDGFMPPWRPLQ